MVKDLEVLISHFLLDRVWCGLLSFVVQRDGGFL